MMTLNDLDEILKQVGPGYAARVPYDTFERLFPPGVEHDPPKEAAYNLAKKHGLKIDNRPDGQAVYFYRD